MRGMEQFVKRPTTRDFPAALEVEINNDVAGVNDVLGVVEVGDNGLFHASVRWSPRAAVGGILYPSRGDVGLLIVSDQGTPWLVDWSPS